VKGPNHNVSYDTILMMLLPTVHSSLTRRSTHSIKCSAIHQSQK